MHYAISVQIPLLGAEAAGNAATAEQRHHEDEHHYADNDADKLANPEIRKLLRPHKSSKHRSDRDRERI